MELHIKMLSHEQTDLWGQNMISKRVNEMLSSQVSYPFARKYATEVGKAINLASNESPYGPSPRVFRAIERSSARIGSYPDPRASKLKLAISSYIGVKRECVAVGNGSDEIFDLICKAFIDTGDKSLIPTPTFSMYEITCRINGGKPKFIELPNFEWRTAELAREMGSVKLVFIGRPNNPTGNSISVQGLNELLETGKLVVVDEAYVEFAGSSIAKQAPKKQNLLVLRTFSKAFGLAGLRVGYATGNSKLIEILEKIRAPFSINTLAQAAAIEALRDRRYLRKVVTAVRKERAYLRCELSNLGMRVLPSDANFLMVDVSPLKTDASQMCKFLAKRNILIRNLSNFRGVGTRWVRITVGTRPQNEKLVQALKKFKGGRK